VDGSDRVLVDAILALAWSDVLGLVTEHAGAGRPGRAVVVEDEIVTGGAQADDLPPLAAVLEAIGATAAEDAPAAEPRAMRVERVAPAEGDGVAAALRLLLDAAGPVRILADVSRAMDRPVRLAPVPPPVAQALGGAPAGATPRRFAAEFCALLDAGARRGAQVVTLARERAVGGLELLDHVAPFEMRPDERLVDFGGHGEGRRIVALPFPSLAPAAYLVASPGLGRHPVEDTRVALVIDLTQDGQGVALARAHGCAYWRPVAE
jgi:hypothetical protein